MTRPLLPESQVDPRGGGSIVLIVMDGLGGLPDPETGRTELETARTPNLDGLAARSSLGMLVPVGPGITPGSGPGHLSLFGYDPLEYVIGRGALSALGVGMELASGDVAARLNLATFDDQDRVTDRRAGRPSDAEARRVVEKVRGAVEAPEGVRLTLVPEKEHRVVLHIRGEGLGADLTDTDPLVEGEPAHRCEATDPGSEFAAELVRSFLAQARNALADEPALNGFLARGFARFEGIPSQEERFGLRGVAIAKYPMYRGVARLVGMNVDGVPGSTSETVDHLEAAWGKYDLYFLHFKDTDTRGHDGDFAGKVAAIEEVDRLIPRVLDLDPEVVIVTGDHSTPTRMKEHSWHPVPTLLASPLARPSAAAFGEGSCRGGDLGTFHGTHLIPQALAHAGRLVKFGA
ncbi:MAG: 2,3-bisphosphoglycerate-independent phosphoglycerate mutase [Gemmatimonadales bacterium]|jgi:2,3-bisphosphoglycerate-independent phosphoglycerate mutase|nr:MAG: 2,3-bisphosphoglycerate-independent phosphoglycerate mutase [Gemmatimonadales bacterium]